MATDRLVMATDGDLILVCEGRELQVSSHKLSAASPVFCAMFGPHFSEGHALRNATEGSLITVSLPDDSFMTIEALCHAIHHAKIGDLDSRGYRTEEEAVLAFALLVDKYQCVEATEKAVTGYFKELIRPCGVAQIALLIRATYLLDHAQYFQEYTDLFMHFNFCWDTRKETMVADGVFYDISENVHDAARERLLHAQDNLSRKTASVCEYIAFGLTGRHRDSHTLRWQGQCEHCSAVAKSYLEAFVGKNIWPETTLQDELPLRDRLFAIRTLILPGHAEVDAICSQNVMSWQARVNELKEFTMNAWFGLCLDCIKNGSRADSVCRIPHEDYSTTLRPNKWTVESYEESYWAYTDAMNVRGHRF